MRRKLGAAAMGVLSLLAAGAIMGGECEFDGDFFDSDFDDDDGFDFDIDDDDFDFDFDDKALSAVQARTVLWAA